MRKSTELLKILKMWRRSDCGIEKRFVYSRNTTFSWSILNIKLENMRVVDEDKYPHMFGDALHLASLSPSLFVRIDLLKASFWPSLSQFNNS
ncbi:hypothetical protein H5410_040390 [Solanum commersonii]|uniref:Uncharacterized protein n=1 Tax=Solanum commersonii TaxID=4109 RepID=A0A9J5XR92_SOLCO|nr:hypothetical protein H5410_040390 [Solanum commersonii]